jgi:hypothetical protein
MTKVSEGLEAFNSGVVALDTYMVAAPQALKRSPKRLLQSVK